MLKKIYIHQYRCLQNFEINLSALNSALLLGKNGSGKSTIFDAVELLQKIGRGVSSISDLIKEEDFSFAERQKPISIEVEAELQEQHYIYTLEVEFPENFHTPKIKKEILKVDGREILVREGGKTSLHQSKEFTLDWHHIGLPLIFNTSENGSIATFKEWLGRMIVLSPWPASFASISKQQTPYLDRQATNITDWVRYILAESPSLYNKISEFLKQRMPDFDIFSFETTGKNERELVFTFHSDAGQKFSLGFGQLSDGEKIYFLTAAVLAAISAKIPVLCLWDEPDNFIALREISHFITAFRKEFENHLNGSQLLISTHNPRVINEFSSHNTFILSRASHMQPTRLLLLQDKEYLSPSVVDAFENGELD